MGFDYFAAYDRLTLREWGWAREVVNARLAARKEARDKLAARTRRGR